MNIWIDTEFNDFNGSLISMALVAENGQYWYNVLSCEDPTPWVAEHVMPILGKPALSYDVFQQSLRRFLNEFSEGITLIADWPEDFRHFLGTLITGPGRMMTVPRIQCDLQLHLPATADESKIPHNALEDAKALARWAAIQNGTPYWRNSDNEGMEFVD